MSSFRETTRETGDRPAATRRNGSWRPGDSTLDWTPVPGRMRLKSVESCERQEWTLMLWPKEALEWQGEALRPSERALKKDSAPPQRVPFFCGSWRCRRCARWRGAVDWSRCKEGLDSSDWWLYIVLGCPTANYATPFEAFIDAGRKWDKILRRRFERATGAPLRYLQTWEAFTHTRFPHCNLLLSGSELRLWVESLGGIRKAHRRNPWSGKWRTHTIPRGFRRWLKKASHDAGFGFVVWAEIMETSNPEAMAGYLIKLAKELTGASLGAPGKGAQAPIDAPRHFRRIRASNGLLPKMERSGGKFTGVLDRSAFQFEPYGEKVIGQSASGPRKPVSWSDVLRAYADEMARRCGETQEWAYHMIGIEHLTRPMGPVHSRNDQAPAAAAVPYQASFESG